MTDESFASKHWDLDSHEVSLRAVNGRGLPNTPKSGRLDYLATRGFCSQPGVFEQEGFFGVIFFLNAETFLVSVRRNHVFCFHMNAQSSSVKGSSPGTQNSDAVEWL